MKKWFLLTNFLKISPKLERNSKKIIEDLCSNKSSIFEFEALKKIFRRRVI